MLFETSRANLNYEVDDSTNGKWVTLVNGHTRSLKDFVSLRKRLKNEGFGVLLFDNRGSGNTQNENNFTYDDLVRDVLNLWDHLNIEKSHILGISMGGMIAQGVALRYSERIDKLILISTSYCYENLNNKKEWGDTLETVRYKLVDYFAENFTLNSKLLIDGMVKQIHNDILNKNFIGKVHEQKKGMKNFLISPKELNSIKSKTLILHGNEDKIIPLKMAEKLSEYIPNSKLFSFEKVGHLLLAEMPQKLYDTILEFIKGS